MESDIEDPDFDVTLLRRSHAHHQDIGDNGLADIQRLESLVEPAQENIIAVKDKANSSTTSDKDAASITTRFNSSDSDTDVSHISDPDTDVSHTSDFDASGIDTSDADADESCANGFEVHETAEMEFSSTYQNEADQEHCQSVNLSKLNPVELMTVPVGLGGTVQFALVDTGASQSMIRADLLPAESVVAPNNVMVQGLGPEKIHTSGTVELEFTIGAVTFREKFVVISNIHHPVTLGNSFFSQNEIALHFPNKITGKIDRGVWEYYPADELFLIREVPVYAINSETLTEVPTLVKVQLPSSLCNLNGEQFFDALSVKRNKMTVEPGVLDVRQGGAEILACTDKSDSQWNLKSGTVVGCVSSIVEVETAQVNCAQAEEDDSTVDPLSLIGVAHLSPAEQDAVLGVLAEHRAAISLGDHDIGCVGLTSHRIELYDSTPIRIKTRRFSEPVTNEIEKQCEELRQLGIIKFSKSPWSAPVVPIRKKDGTLRLCVDYRKLNSVTKPDRFPMPNMQDLVFSLRGTKYFTSLDLVRGYYQVKLDPATAECTGFSTPNHHYEFARLPFGLRNAPGAFQREMRAVLKDFDSREVVVYIDDVLILGSSFAEHLDLVDRVMKTIIEAGMKIKPKKCTWFQPQVRFLGHEVGCSGVKKTEEYTEAVTNYPRPENVKQLRSFMGLVNFQRKFVANCSVISRSLNQLLKEKDHKKVDWTPERVDAFENLKAAMREDIQLVYPDYREDAAPLELSVDASLTGAGGCLAQVQEGETRVIAYFSTTFNQAQCNYSTVERELEGIRWVVAVCRNFIVGVNFILYTDHRPLVYMMNMSKANARIMRTFHELSEYDFIVKYR